MGFLNNNEQDVSKLRAEIDDLKSQLAKKDEKVEETLQRNRDAIRKVNEKNTEIYRLKEDVRMLKTKLTNIEDDKKFVEIMLEKLQKQQAKEAKENARALEAEQQVYKGMESRNSDQINNVIKLPHVDHNRAQQTFPDHNIKGDIMHKQIDGLNQSIDVRTLSNQKSFQTNRNSMHKSKFKKNLRNEHSNKRFQYANAASDLQRSKQNHSVDQLEINIDKTISSKIDYFSKKQLKLSNKINGDALKHIKPQTHQLYQSINGPISSFQIQQQSTPIQQRKIDRLTRNEKAKNLTIVSPIATQNMGSRHNSMDRFGGSQKSLPELPRTKRLRVGRGKLKKIKLAKLEGKWKE